MRLVIEYMTHFKRKLLMLDIELTFAVIHL